MLIGQRMWSDTVGPVAGVVARKPIHLLTEEERKQVAQMKDLWLISEPPARKRRLLVRIGDAVTVELAYREVQNCRAVSPAMDDKCGLWVVEACDGGRRQPLRLACGLHGPGRDRPRGRTVRLRHRPASGHRRGRDPCHRLPDCQKEQEGDESGQGPVVYRGPNMTPKVVERLISAAEANQIPYQPAPGSFTPTDANSIQ